MLLKQIDIIGFKSFADKVVFSLSDGITAIVGPNGSGKSNVADAVRWVLGEQSAHALRGVRMEDVIFNGSVSRKPISLCEVALLFDNSDCSLPIQSNEVSITRKLYRNGESEYLINNQAVRMRDIHALFYDTGVGREGYSIIGQGRIEEILSAKGEERREALEEAAGVMKYKIRREEAQRKLASVAGDIVRIEDILTELEQSLDPLREQKEKAMAAVALENRLKTLDINVFLNQYEKNRTRVSTLNAELQSVEQEENANKKSIGESQGALSILETKTSLLEELLHRAEQKKGDLASTVQRLNSQKEMCGQKIEFLCQQKLSLDEQYNALETQRRELQQRTVPGASGDEQALIALEQTVTTLAGELEESNTQIEALEESLDGGKQRLLQLVDGDAQRKAHLARMETLNAQAREREAEIAGRLAKALQERNEIECEIDQSKEQLRSIKASEAEAKTLLSQQVLAQQSAQKRLESSRQALLQAQGETQRRENSLRTQRQLQHDYEGYNNSVKNLMRDIQARAVDSTGVIGTFASLIQVPKELETATEQALGQSLQNIVVDTQQTAKRLIEHLRQRQYGRITFLPEQSLRPNPLSPREKSQITGPGILGVAFDLIRFEDAARKSVEYLLGRTVMAESIEAGIALINRCAFSFRCVTLKGDILQSSGPMTGGSVREFSLISRERLVKQAEEAVATAADAQRRAEKQLEDDKHEADASDASYSGFREKLFVLQSDVRLAEERHEATILALQRTISVCDQLEVESQRIGAMREDAQRELDSAGLVNSSNESELRLSIEKDSVRLLELRSIRDALAQKLAGQREALAVGRAEKRNRDALAETAREELGRVQKNIEANETQMVSNDASQAESKKLLVRIQDELEAALLSQNENENALAAVQVQHEAYQLQRTQLIENVENARTAIMEQQERKFRIQTQLQRLESDFEHIQERMWDNYELTYAKALPLKTEVNLQGAAKEAEEIREQLREMGEVYRGAIEEYQRVETRYTYLKTQKEDLEKAQTDLDRLIHELTAQMQKQFLEQFDIINSHFDRVFKTLFGGGRAELVLGDPKQAMECSIDIIAQPPGKNLQLITLLSGGERALTAIALLFALLEVRATPFCILDEIEAALDEENLRLFAEFLKAYSKSTQFVVITHRRSTMEAASYMYGIAMEEAGVSKTVSVKFA